MRPFTSVHPLAQSIRALSLDAIDSARSGHPGLPLGCADILAVLYGFFLRIHPDHPEWINRDRFVLSAGHGSAGLYAALHVAGFPLSRSDLQRFRQLHSPTAGHPEYGEVVGVETTTGPLGQGLATAVGMALQAKRLGAQLDPSLIDHQVVVLAGDGCLMEGVSSEASSLAGHWQLDNLIVIYDANEICLDGPISDCFTEDVAARYRAYGWFVTSVDGHDEVAIATALVAARQRTGCPTLLIARTVIGKGSAVAGTSEVHGKPLGPEETEATKSRLGIPTDPFWVSNEAGPIMAQHHEGVARMMAEWEVQLAKSGHSIPPHRSDHPALSDTLAAVRAMTIPSGVATRVASHHVIQTVAAHYPPLVGGSADLSCSDSTWMTAFSACTPGHWDGRNIKFGVREFAMAAICSGVALGGHAHPFCGTFLTFSDYMKNAIRLAAMMGLPVVYQLTHDSLFLGEDGPTHQPVEHLASLRSIPRLTVYRPADGTETKAAWYAALQSDRPVALVLSRQGLPDTGLTSMDGALRGAYVMRSAPQATVVVLATGSEVHLAVSVADLLATEGVGCQLVSMPSWEVFMQQSPDYQREVLGPSGALRVSIEAQSSFGWHRWIGSEGLAISMDGFGLSAPAHDLAAYFGFTPSAIVSRILDALGTQS